MLPLSLRTRFSVASKSNYDWDTEFNPSRWRLGITCDEHEGQAAPPENLGLPLIGTLRALHCILDALGAEQNYNTP